MSHESRKKFFLVLGGALLMAGLVTYIVMVVYFQEHFLWNTTINQKDYSKMTVDEVENLVKNQEKGYLLEIRERENRKETISAEEIGLIAVFGDQIKEIKEKQNEYLWFLSLFSDNSYHIETLVDYNEDQFEKKVSSLRCMQKKNQKAPKDAYISDYQNGGYRIVPEVEGTTLNEKKVKQCISDSIKNLKKSLELEKEKCYLEPEIRKDYQPMVRALEEMNHYAGVSMTYLFGKDKAVLDGEKTHEYITVDEDYQVDFNFKKIESYVKKLAKKYDTYQKEITFDTAVGTTVKFSGNYGWVLDQKKTVKQMKNALKTGESFEKTPTFSQEGFGKYSKSLGGSYIEIDITGQHIYCYRKGKRVMDTAVVTGCVSKGMATPVGIYTVFTKMKDHVMRGPDYAQFVSYFMPFNGGIGFHDANWRGSFGGNIYLYNGSHGCINMVHSAAAQLWDYVEVGIPVIVYKAENAIEKEKENG